MANTNKRQIDAIQLIIDTLDQLHEENINEIYARNDNTMEKVQASMFATLEHKRKREDYLRQIENLKDLHPATKSFLNQEIIISKFDVDSGLVSIQDNDGIPENQTGKTI